MPSDPHVLSLHFRGNGRTSKVFSGLALEMTSVLLYCLWEGCFCSPPLSSQTRGLSLNIDKVIFFSIPRSAYFFLPSFSAVYMNAALPPTNTHGVLGTLTPLSSRCKEEIAYLASIHSPSHAVQRVLSLPNQGLNSQCLGFQRLLVWWTDLQSSAKAVGARHIYPIFHGSICQWTMSSLPPFLNHLL